MSTDLKRLKEHFKAYEPTLKELERKYQVNMRRGWKCCNREICSTKESFIASNLSSFGECTEPLPSTLDG